MTRVVSALAVLACAAIALLLAWPQLFGMQWSTGIAQAVALRGLAIVVALIGAVAFTILGLLSPAARRFAGSLALVSLGFAALTAIVLATRGFGNLAFETKGPADVTVLSWNTLGDAPGADVIAGLALESDADIIALPETTNAMGLEIAQLMQVAGRPMWVYTVAYDEVSKARSTTLLVSVDLGEYVVDETATTTAVLPSFVATPADGDGPTIVVVHTVAPIPPMERTWVDDLGWVAEQCPGGDVILAGDFNATLDHFSGLPRTDGADLGSCHDAAAVTDNAAVGTWPTQLPALLGAPIDHVLVSDAWRVTGMRVVQSVDGAGSDHRPVLVQLQRAD